MLPFLAKLQIQDRALNLSNLQWFNFANLVRIRYLMIVQALAKNIPVEYVAIVSSWDECFSVFGEFPAVNFSIMTWKLYLYWNWSGELTFEEHNRSKHGGCSGHSLFNKCSVDGASISQHMSRSINFLFFFLLKKCFGTYFLHENHTTTSSPPSGLNFFAGTRPSWLCGRLLPENALGLSTGILLDFPWLKTLASRYE